MSLPSNFLRVAELPDGLTIEFPDISRVRAGQILTLNGREASVMSVTTQWGMREWAPGWWVNQTQTVVVRWATATTTRSTSDLTQPPVVVVQ